jgi:hypothetical protein
VPQSLADRSSGASAGIPRTRADVRRAADRPDRRSLPEEPDADPSSALVAYLSTGRTGSAQALAEKAVVLLDQEPLRGQAAWPPS